jgi:hypothetical protein
MKLTQPYRISPTHDTPFKFLFAQQNESEELLAGLLNYTLKLKGDRRIVKLDYQNVEMSPMRPKGRKLIVDLLVTDQGDVTYNIEIQREDTSAIINRALFQQSRITGAQLSSRDVFDELTPVVIVLLCRYSTFPDREVVRLFQLAPFALDEVRGRETLPCRSEHFDGADYPRYHQLKRRVADADKSLDLLRIYLVELSKDLGALDPDQKACIDYLMTDYTPSTPGEDPMNAKPQRVPQYHIPDGASPEVRAWIEQAQERLERFAAMPEQRLAYERELLERLEHNSLIKRNRDEGLEEGIAIGEERGIAIGEERGIAIGEERGIAIGEARMAQKHLSSMKLAVESLRRAGLDDEEIARSLDLTDEERDALLASGNES